MDNEPRHPEISVKLSGSDGNAFAIIGSVAKALRRAGHPEDAKAFAAEAMEGDYNGVLVAAMNWVDAGIEVGFGHGVLQHVAVTAMKLQTLVNDPYFHIGQPPFGHRCLFRR